MVLHILVQRRREGEVVGIQKKHPNQEAAICSQPFSHAKGKWKEEAISASQPIKAPSSTYFE